MAKTKVEKKKSKRKVKQKERRLKVNGALKREKAEYHYFEAIYYWDADNLDKALLHLEKATRLDPKNEEFLNEMGRLGSEMDRPDVELKALLSLYDIRRITPDQMYFLCRLLKKAGKHKKAFTIIQEILPLFSRKRGRKKDKEIRDILIRDMEYCHARMEARKRPAAIKKSRGITPSSPAPTSPVRDKRKPAGVRPLENKTPLPRIPIAIRVDTRPLKQAITEGKFGSLEDFELTIYGYEIRLKEMFENLICLNTLNEVRSFWYQEETARKVLKVFRGRALLSDEVGLGKTIEALIVLKEYIQRGMVKNALILTPTPLVSQWKEELKAKFGLDFASTDDPAYRAKGTSLWKKQFVLASINLAKSKKNFQAVTEKEYDMVIIDEAHHLKNRNTLNWKLINTLKKRFLLLLTATPVENNLMELYNLVTLLKPGQLSTASDFRKEYMTRGDPTDPQNRSQLKELLGQVMIRNTRAIARIDIPPRFARTIKVAPHKLEIDLYERISSLVMDMAATNGTGRKLLLKTLLEEAGSSPRAVALTLSRFRAKHDMLLKHEIEIRAIGNMCRSLDENSKNRMLLKLITASPGKKIVFVKYLGTLDHVSEFLEWHGISCALFHGKMNNQKKDEQIQNFREDVDILVTTEIGGEGRNLQFCHQMVNYDLPWNPMKIEQRIGRIHRIGQEKEVMIYNLCAAGSAEDYILQILDKKINMFEMVIGEIDMVLGRVTGDREFSEVVYDIWINSRSEQDREKGFAQLGTTLKRAKTGYKKTKDLDKKLFGENYEL
ncbi:MAG: DEAD/DEAH box helicase family protein [Deltaproteobacteria bacterium]|nr:DEAD/DEAH box helicase family protein [Deltaproteobacteria bacterium]